MTDEIQDAQMVPVQSIDRTQISRARNDAITKLVESAYSKAGELRLTKEESDALLVEFPDDAFRSGAAGKENLIYIEHGNLRDRFNEVFGLGQWTLIPIRDWQEDFEHEKWENNQKRLVQGIRIYREIMLMVRGCFCGSAVGDMDYYPNNNQANYGDAYEGAKTAAFRRCAKEFGVGLQAWRKQWCDGWWARKGSTKPEHNGMQPGAKNATQQRREAEQQNFETNEEAIRGHANQPPQQPQQGGQYPPKKVCPKCMAQAVGRSMYPPRGNPDGEKGWFCLTPDTPILYDDFTWRPIGEAKIGDKIVAFDEYSTATKARRFKPSVIENVWFSKKKTRRFLTDEHDITTTDEHKWLIEKSGRCSWSTTSGFRVGTAVRSIGMTKTPLLSDDYRKGYLAGITLGDGTLRFDTSRIWQIKKPYWRVALKSSDESALGRIAAYLTNFGIEAHVRPFACGTEGYSMKKVEMRADGNVRKLMSLIHSEESLEYQRGFLAGFYDAEGTCQASHLRVYQKDADVLRRVQRYAGNLKFKFDISGPQNGVSVARLSGTMLDRIRFLCYVQPSLTRKSDFFDRRAHHVNAPILHIEDAEMRDVVDITTSSRTFYAAGLASHNCYPKSGGCNTAFAFNDPSFAEGEQSRPPQPSSTKATATVPTKETATTNGVNPQTEASLAEIAEAVAMWKAWIANPKLTLESCNRLMKENIAEVKAMGTKAQQNIWAVLKAGALNRGWAFDGVAKEFVEQ